MFWQVEDVPSVPSVPDFQSIPGVPSVPCVPCFSNDRFNGFDSERLARDISGRH